MNLQTESHTSTQGEWSGTVWSLLAKWELRLERQMSVASGERPVPFFRWTNYNIWWISLKRRVA